jgi:hypothetical protein
VDISIKSNIDQLSRKLPGFYKKQIPFATSQALNDTARLIATQDVRDDMETELDRPTPFTKGGVRYKRSNKRNLTAQVFMMPTRWGYMTYAVNGGVRQAKGKLIAIGVGKRNKYGNKPRAWIKRMIARPDTFWQDVDGVLGLYQRMARGRTKLLAITTPQASYTKRFDYLGSVEQGVQQRFNGLFTRRLRAAIDNARI